MLTDSLARLAVALHRQVRGDGNAFFSPLSLLAALAMVREGARGETAAELDRALSLPRELGAASRDLATALRPPTVEEWDDARKLVSVPVYELELASALWGQKGLPFSIGFVAALQEDHGAPLQRVDFSEPEEARWFINAWVEERTRRRIEGLVPEGRPSPDSLLLLTNAIYYKAAWDSPFDEHDTRDAPFFAPRGQVTARFMRKVQRLRYAEDDAAQVVAIPYLERATSLIVVLPRRRDGLAVLEDALTAERLASWTAALRPTRVDLQLPRFRLAHAFDASEPLGALGVRRLFDPAQADLSGMIAPPPPALFVSAVLHKAFVAVDEAGTEAAAATLADVELTGAFDEPPPPAVRFVADHPLLFMIRHDATGAVLFMGRLTAP